MEEQLPHIQVATSSKRLVCSTLARIDNTSQEALLDSGSTISSISIDLVNSLNLPTSPAAQIQVVFGDKQQTYRSSTQAHCTFFLAQHKFLHSFYVLPRQLFPMTLGCDWFIKTGAQLHFDTQSLVLPSLKPFTTIPLFSSPQLSNHIMHTQVHLESTTVRTADIRRLLREFPTLFRKTATTTQINLLVQHTIPTATGQPVRMAAR